MSQLQSTTTGKAFHAFGEQFFKAFADAYIYLGKTSSDSVALAYSADIDELLVEYSTVFLEREDAAGFTASVARHTKEVKNTTLKPSEKGRDTQAIAMSRYLKEYFEIPDNIDPIGSSLLNAFGYDKEYFSKLMSKNKINK